MLKIEADDTGPIWIRGGLLRWVENFLPFSRNGGHWAWQNEAIDAYLSNLHHLAPYPKRIKITGHSRGGAVAMYLAELFAGQNRYEDTPAEITVEITGAPRMWFGSKGRLRDAYVREHCEVKSLIARGDLVTMLPPWFRHTESKRIGPKKLMSLRAHHPDYYKEHAE